MSAAARAYIIAAANAAVAPSEEQVQLAAELRLDPSVLDGMDMAAARYMLSYTKHVRKNGRERT